MERKNILYRYAAAVIFAFTIGTHTKFIETPEAYEPIPGTPCLEGEQNTTPDTATIPTYDLEQTWNPHTDIEMFYIPDFYSFAEGNEGYLTELFGQQTNELLQYIIGFSIDAEMYRLLIRKEKESLKIFLTPISIQEGTSQSSPPTQLTVNKAAIIELDPYSIQIAEIVNNNDIPKISVCEGNKGNYFTETLIGEFLKDYFNKARTIIALRENPYGVIA